MAKILTLEQALAQLPENQVKKVPVEKLKRKTLVKEARTENTPKTNSLKLAADARGVLNFYINKIPDVKILENQITLIKQEMLVYSKNKSTDNYNKSKEFLNELVEKRNAINKIFSRDGYSLNDARKQKEIEINIKNSPELKALRIKQTEIKQKLKDNTPNSIMSQLTRIQKQIKLSQKISNSTIYSLDDDTEEEFDFNDIPAELQKEYYDFLLFIGSIIKLNVVDIKKLKNSEILALLHINIGSNQSIKGELTRINLEMASIKNKLSETITVTDIIHNIFDFKTDTTGGKIPKDILAASNIGLVNSIAYKVASNLNKLHELNDAVCGGMLGLMKAIDAWYNLAKLSDSALSFKGFANIYIANYAKRAIQELSITGTSASTKATLETKEKQTFQDFVKYNPEFQELDKDVIINFIDATNSTNKTLKTVAETDYNAIVGGDGDGSVDIWSINDFDSSGYDHDEAKENYIRLLKSIQQLLELFETKTSNKSGFAEVGNKRMFDKYDRKIFLMYFGIEFKREQNTGKGKAKSEYTQEEMADEIVAMFRADGQLGRDGKPKTMSQPALSARITKILKNIKIAMEYNHNLKDGFEYLYNYYLANKEALVDMSNYREELGISIDREELKEIYVDNEQQLNRPLTDGKRLNDIFEISDDNPLDSEIAGLFNEYL